MNNPTRGWPHAEIVSNGLAATGALESGGAWVASSTGIVLLGMVLEAATGQSWQSLYEQYVFGPLGLTDTSFPAADELQIPGPHPQGYAAALHQGGQAMCETVRDVTVLSNSMSWVAGGVVSTVEDLRTWSQALAEGSLLSEKSAKAQWSTVPMGPNAAAWQGYGLGVQQLGPLRGQDGAIPGFITASYADPSSGLTVVVMLNNSSAGGRFAQALALRLASIASKAPSAGDEPAPTIVLPWSEEQAVATLQAAAVCPPAVAATG